MRPRTLLSNHLPWMGRRNLSLTIVEKQVRRRKASEQLHPALWTRVRGFTVREAWYYSVSKFWYGTLSWTDWNIDDGSLQAGFYFSAPRSSLLWTRMTRRSPRSATWHMKILLRTYRIERWWGARRGMAAIYILTALWFSPSSFSFLPQHLRISTSPSLRRP